MDSKKGMNWFFAFFAFTLGLTLIKHIDFKNLTLKEPVLDILYIVVFVIINLHYYKRLEETNRKIKTATNIGLAKAGQTEVIEHL